MGIFNTQLYITNESLALYYYSMVVSIVSIYLSLLHYHPKQLVCDTEQFAIHTNTILTSLIFERFATLFVDFRDLFPKI